MRPIVLLLCKSQQSDANADATHVAINVATDVDARSPQDPAMTTEEKPAKPPEPTLIPKS